MKILILNASPYGPKDENGIGKNCVIQYIPYLDEMKWTERSKGYYVSYNVIYDKDNKCLFQNLEHEDFLTPYEVEMSSPNLRQAKIIKLTKLD